MDFVSLVNSIELTSHVIIFLGEHLFILVNKDVFLSLKSKIYKGSKMYYIVSEKKFPKIFKKKHIFLYSKLIFSIYFKWTINQVYRRPRTPKLLVFFFESNATEFDCSNVLIFFCRISSYDIQFVNNFDIFTTMK